jgi:hypothetical protein
MTFGLVGFVWSIVECVRLLRLGDPLTGGGVISTFIGMGFCILAATTAMGLFRANRWARVVASIIAVLLGLYCLSFLAMVGTEFGVIAYAASWIGVAFVAYTFTVIWILRPHDHIA